MEKIYCFRWLQLLIFWSLFYIALAFIMNQFILTETWFYNVLGSQLAQERITTLLQTQEKFRWLTYLFIPVLLLLKWLTISALLYVAFLLANIPQKFICALKILIIAEFAPAIAGLVKTIILLVNKPESLQELQFFYPLSLGQFANFEKMPVYLSYALQQINLFEIAYWLLLMLGITAFTGKKLSSSFKLVAASYGVAFCCWILLVTFIQLQLS